MAKSGTADFDKSLELTYPFSEAHSSQTIIARKMGIGPFKRFFSGDYEIPNIF